MLTVQDPFLVPTIESTPFIKDCNCTQGQNKRFNVILHWSVHVAAMAACRDKTNVRGFVVVLDLVTTDVQITFSSSTLQEVAMFHIQLLSFVFLL